MVEIHGEKVEHGGHETMGIKIDTGMDGTILGYCIYENLYLTVL